MKTHEAEIKGWAAELGFDDCRIARAGEAAHAVDFASGYLMENTATWDDWSARRNAAVIRARICRDAVEAGATPPPAWFLKESQKSRKESYMTRKESYMTRKESYMTRKESYMTRKES